MDLRGGCRGENGQTRPGALRGMPRFFRPCWLFFRSFFWFFFRLVFLFAFESFWGAMLGRFGSQNRDKIRCFVRCFFVLIFCSFWGRFGVRFWDVFGAQIGSTCVYAIFCFLLIFLKFFNVFCVSEGVMFVLFRFFFRFVFGIHFLSFFGSILGSLWEAFESPTRSFQASIFGIDF